MKTNGKSKASASPLHAGEGPAPRTKREKKPALTMDVREDGIAVITYDVPGEAVNTLQADFAEEFDRIFEQLASDSAIRGAILVSGKKDTWLAGANFHMLLGCKTPEDATALCKIGKAAMNKLAALEKPVVAAIHGAALAGGLELALACHARVASDDPKTILGLSEVQLGLIPGANGMQRLAQLIGLQEALDMSLTGKNVRPAKAK
jgi:3-hydroxyacyl-CoA dehydrogenase/enoyl-CoA hydratase/3-hydroxybutyryl-CoA epimerase